MDQEANTQTAVSPHAYVQQQFREVCQEISAQPQEALLLIMFDFLRMTPELRGVHIATLKTAFNKFAASADFEELQKVLDDAIKKVELQLYDHLAEQWVDDAETE